MREGVHEGGMWAWQVMCVREGHVAWRVDVHEGSRCEEGVRGMREGVCV